MFCSQCLFQSIVSRSVLSKTYSSKQVHESMFGKLTCKECSYPVPVDVQALLATGIGELRFQFWDPVEVLMRLLLTGPLSADNSNLQFGPRDGDYYEDFCDGDRLRRVYAYSLPKKGTALTCVLFFDKINMDEKGFASGDGVLIVGGFFTRRARESTLAKASLGTFPNFNVPKVNRDRKVIKDFKKAYRAYFHSKIYECFLDFNRRGGAQCALQSGVTMHFEKAIILAIYADQPAATECTLTGSACPVCYTPRELMSQPGSFVMRSPETMQTKRNFLLRQSIHRPVPCRKMAAKLGIKLHLDNGWIGGEGVNCPFGPNPIKDNIYQNIPQVMLHGMDEGLTKKLCIGVLEATIEEAKIMRRLDATTVSL